MNDLDRPGEVRGLVLNNNAETDVLLRDLADLGISMVVMPVVFDECHQFRSLAVQYVFTKRLRVNRRTEEKLRRLVWQLKGLAREAVLDELDACGHGGQPFTAIIRCELDGGYIFAEEIHHREPFLGLRNKDTVVLRKGD